MIGRIFSLMLPVIAQCCRKMPIVADCCALLPKPPFFRSGNNGQQRAASSRENRGRGCLFAVFDRSTPKAGKMPSKKLRITLYVTPEEHAVIAASATRAQRSLSDFCKRVSMGYHVPGLEHIALRQELRHLKGDLGQVGGLLKLALSEGADRFQINRLLRELDLRQAEIREAIGRVE